MLTRAQKVGQLHDIYSETAVYPQCVVVSELRALVSAKLKSEGLLYPMFSCSMNRDNKVRSVI